MSDLDTSPQERTLPPRPTPPPVRHRIEARNVPLGGVRGMSVSRTLPAKELPTVGPWCFFDQMGPQRVAMQVFPHPHIGLQTVTWLLQGLVRHRDSLGSDVVIAPGELNLMTSGRGISHSEFSIVGPDPGGEHPADLLHGLQLWLALPAAEAAGPGRFEQHRNLPQWRGDGVIATVFIGELGEVRSPARVHTPLTGADLDLADGAAAELPARADFEYAVLVIDGEITVEDTDLAVGPLLYLGAGRDRIRIGSTTGARAVLLGGEPFAEDLVMWWNFVGRSHDEITAARQEWESAAARFGTVADHDTRIPAPEIPPLRLLPRSRRL